TATVDRPLPLASAAATTVASVVAMAAASEAVMVVDTTAGSEHSDNLCFVRHLLIKRASTI
ncbi:hypothetical protein, partial [Escherichia coli]|uniref:hypothetical protein n=1 Tax=Escherichia coli TaxID=562 RepID=UPI0019D633C7